jgi:hypothetical protein
MKKTIIVALVFLAILSGFLYFKKNRINNSAQLSNSKFTGVLQKVDTSCFFDGECFVVVSGNHVTLLMGWTDKTVGKVIGSDSIGDLEKYIGQNIEVYAAKTSDNNFTLYGDEDYYIKVLPK